MAIGGISSAGEKNTAPKRMAPDSSTLQMEDFMKLLSVQMQNQDMDNPMSNSEMMGQLTSMATVQAMNTFSELSSTQYAVGLIGKEVQVSDIDPVTNKMTLIGGTVSGINLSNMTFFLKDSTKAYGLGNVMEIGTIKKDPNDTNADGLPDDEDETTKPPEGGGDKPEGPEGGGDKPEGPEGGGDKPEGPDSGGDKPGDGGDKPNPPEGGTGDDKTKSSGNEASKSRMATLPDGRASTPVGRTAADSGRASASDRTPSDSVRASASDRTPSDSVRASASGRTPSDSVRASASGRTPSDGVRASASGRTPSDSSRINSSRSESGNRRGPGGREDTPGMAQDKIDALAEQAARTIPADKAASLERDRLYRSSVSHIGPGSWA